MSTNNLDDFEIIIEDIIGMYFDSTTGYTVVHQHKNTWQEAFVNQYNISIEQQDKAPMSYGKGQPDDPNTVHLHVTTNGQHKANNAPGGRNHTTIGNLSICQIYSYWEDCYRKLIAQDFGIDKNDLRLDIFGDIRLLRNAIVHHRGIALEKIEKYQLTKWYNSGDIISIDPNKFEFIMQHVRAAIRHFRARYAMN